MRRIITFNNVSADGYFAAPDGNLNWVINDDEIFMSSQERNPNVDTMLFGRKTFEMFEKAWRDNKVIDPHTQRESPATKMIADGINAMNKLVFSNTLKSVTWKNSTLLGKLTRERVEEVKRGSGGDIIMFGSGQIASQLTEMGLIDEYQFIINPVLLGNGRLLLTNVTKPSRMKLLESRKFEKSGNVLLRYAVAE
jgi:dihydrofolate reductase